MWKRFVVSLILISGLIVTPTTQAEEDYWYVLGAVGQFDGTTVQSTLDDALRSDGASGFRSNVNTPSA
jgi:hypothetical protein